MKAFFLSFLESLKIAQRAYGRLSRSHVKRAKERSFAALGQSSRWEMLDRKALEFGHISSRTTDFEVKTFHEKISGTVGGSCAAYVE